MPVLTTQQVRRRLLGVPNWSQRAQSISRTFKFEGFLQSMEFVNRIAKKAQTMDHHPDIEIRYSKVTLKLTTHAAGGLTGKDFRLARQCDEVYSSSFSS